MNKEITVGIVGGGGYTAGELIRILHYHPRVKIASILSTTQAGKRIDTVHRDLIGDVDDVFTDKLSPEVDVLFLCVDHGKAGEVLRNTPLSPKLRVIDLSNEFRVAPENRFGENIFQYGVPSLYQKEIASATYIANPGCFATAIELALLPLAQAKYVTQPIHVNAITGSTGAGRSLTETSHFSWRDSNVSFYKEFTHQHLSEIKQTLQQASGGTFHQPIYFLPMRGNFTRGILAGVYLPCELAVEEAYELYSAFYQKDSFVKMSRQAIDLKQVVNTNKCLLHIQRHMGMLLITSAIDNLLKGASGQAVQNMNIMLGWDQETGLHLKGSAL